MTRNGPQPRRLRGYISVIDERKMLILDVLRKSVSELTRQEITAALNWPDNILNYHLTKGRAIDPLLLLIEEGKVEKTRYGSIVRYKADPDISKMLRRTS